jgi:hypothetical protein
MSKSALLIALAFLLAPGALLAQGCEFKQGETKYLDWAHCRYGDDAIVALDLPEGGSWDTCIYYLEAFRPAKLLAVTKDENGKEKLSINNRSQVGNPCYLTKQSCDKVLKAAGYN